MLSGVTTWLSGRLDNLGEIIKDQEQPDGVLASLYLVRHQAESSVHSTLLWASGETYLTPAERAAEAAKRTLAAQEKVFKDRLIAPGLKAKIEFIKNADRAPTGAHIVGYKHRGEHWSPAPHLVAGEIVVDDPENPEKENPMVRARVTGSEVTAGGKREYFVGKNSEGVSYVMIPANGGFVPVRHGGDPTTGAWLTPSPQAIHAIVFDSHGWRHPAYPGVDYQAHGFQRVRDWKRRVVFWPTQNGEFRPRPEEVPQTHNTPLHKSKEIPRVPAPEHSHQTEGFIRVGAIAANAYVGYRAMHARYGPRTEQSNCLSTGELVYLAAAQNQTSLPSEAVHTYRDLSGHSDDLADYQRKRTDRSEDLQFQRRHLDDQELHNRQIRESLLSDEYSLHPERRPGAAEARAEREREREMLAERRETAQVERQVEALRQIGRRRPEHKGK